MLVKHLRMPNRRVVAFEGPVCEDEELAHNGSECNDLRFAGGEKTLVKHLEDGVVPRREHYGEIQHPPQARVAGFGQTRALAIDSRLMLAWREAGEGSDRS